METKHKNALIGALLAVVFVMAVGYAAFAQQLTINGSASISSNWNIKITDIQPGSPVGTAVSNSASVGEGGLSASFNASLQSPSDSLTYTVTVHNGGDIDAKLSEWSLSAGDDNTNDPIVYSVNGLTNDEELAAGADKKFTVTVTYNSNVTSQPETGDLTKGATVTLTYTQADQA